MSTDHGERVSTDAQRFSELWEGYAPRVQAYAMRHVDASTAQEVVAETFLVAWRRLADVPGEPLPWLLVVARNTISNQRRSAYRAHLVAHELARLHQVARPEQAAEVTAVERAELLRALASLSEVERESLLLVSWDGLTTAQAAAVAGCSTAAFKVRLHRARRRLAATTAEPDSAGDDGSARDARPLPRAAAATPSPTGVRA